MGLFTISRIVGFHQICALHQEPICQDVVKVHKSFVGQDFLKVLLLQKLRITQLDIVLIFWREDIYIPPLGDDDLVVTLEVNNFLVFFQLEQCSH